MRESVPVRIRLGKGWLMVAAVVVATLTWFGLGADWGMVKPPPCTPPPCTPPPGEESLVSDYGNEGLAKVKPADLATLDVGPRIDRTCAGLEDFAYLCGYTVATSAHTSVTWVYRNTGSLSRQMLSDRYQPYAAAIGWSPVRNCAAVVYSDCGLRLIYCKVIDDVVSLFIVAPDADDVAIVVVAAWDLPRCE
jgi:hypothetical protein